MAKEVVVMANRISKLKKLGRITRITILVLLLLLIVTYLVLRVSMSEGSFIVTLETEDDREAGLSISESLYDRVGKRVLKAESIQFMDNISIKWLPDDIDSDNFAGSHNGENYIAYTFYIENQSKKNIHYWYKLVVDDVIKQVDEAARIMIFLNGEKTVYAKQSSLSDNAEEGTTKFRKDKDGTIILQQRKNLTPNEIDRMTVVVWIEGDDPECIDALIGGELKMHMDITEEHIEN